MPPATAGRPLGGPVRGQGPSGVSIRSSFQQVNPVPSAWQAAELIRKHQSMVWRYLRYLGASSQLAEDLTQEVFLAMLRGGLEQRSEGATAAWLRRVAQNMLRKAWRQRGRHPEELLGGEAEQVWVALEGCDAGAARQAALATCMDLLAPRARQALDLRYGRGADRAAIGVELGMSTEGVKALLRRSRGVLKDCIDKRLEGDGTGGQQ